VQRAGPCIPSGQARLSIDRRGRFAQFHCELGAFRGACADAVHLDHEAIALKPYFLKNATRASSQIVLRHPRFFRHDLPQLGWTEPSDDLRGILFGADGREIERWDKIDDDMTKLQTGVRVAIQSLIDADKAKAAMVAKTQGTKLIQPSSAHPPLPRSLRSPRRN